MRDPNIYFFETQLKNIVLTTNGYELQHVFIPGSSGVETDESKNNPTNNQYTKQCERCKYRDMYYPSTDACSCKINNKLRNVSQHSFVSTANVYKCDAYTRIENLNYIADKDEMIKFISSVENFFGCPEDFEGFFGFERKWDENSGYILETVNQYYERGGKFDNIPDVYPCVIYFDEHSDRLEYIAV